MTEKEISIEDLLYILKKHMRFIMIFTIITTAAAVIVSCYFFVPKYEAYTKLFIGKEIAVSKEGIKNQEEAYWYNEQASYKNTDVEMYQKLLKTYAEIITTNDLIDSAIEGNMDELTSEDILMGLNVIPRDDTQILEISYRNENPVLARDVVGKIVKEFIKTSSDIIPNGNVQVIESAKIPYEPVSPNKKIYILSGFLAGFIFSTGIVFLKEFINSTFKVKEDVEQVLGIPVIGAIPDSI